METAGVSSQVSHHVKAFSTLLSEGSDGTSSERMNTKSVDAMLLLNMESSAISSVDGCGNNEYEIECHEKYCYVKTKSVSAWDTLLMCHKKVTVLYELLSACLAENTDADKNCSLKKGYDARHRVALLVLLTWLNIKWIKMGKEQVEKEGEIINSESSWTMWKLGGIIGAASLTGVTVMAFTGGLAAPAIAQGLGAIAPSLVPAIGASGFAAAASAMGSAAVSVAVAACFGGVTALQGINL
ncbi:hypothetical protein CUMW_280720 [Citrus unshiu]|uniref:Uncharacterized protein n=1 Tax=Citrus unshiu TaxID=55188 RepID=A0A2H5MWW6_CITUN|nr:hypothetical protein CUMW_280720 [Citrus unshiu]